MNDFIFGAGFDNINLLELGKYIAETNLTEKISGYHASVRAMEAAKVIVINSTCSSACPRDCRWLGPDIVDFVGFALAQRLSRRSLHAGFGAQSSLLTDSVHLVVLHCLVVRAGCREGICFLGHASRKLVRNRRHL